jgi:hypothetical protein
LLASLQIAASFKRHHALMTVRMAFHAGVCARAQDKHPRRPDLWRQRATENV